MNNCYESKLNNFRMILVLETILMGLLDLVKFQGLIHTDGLGVYIFYKENIVNFLAISARYIVGN